ncbi:MAG: hypothetical protein ACI3W8_05790 [Oscillospiraceae bacterium]
MDYVKETLQRQSALWRALLSGGGSGMTAEEDAERQSVTAPAGEEEDFFSTAGNGAAAETMGSAARTLSAMAAAPEVTPMGAETDTGEAAAQRESGESAAEQELLRRSRERLLTEMSLPDASETVEGAEAANRKTAWSGEALAAETAQWQAEAALRQGRGDLETADARAISRRFERDARRYDGGFIFY